MYATKVITPSKRNIRERTKVFLLLFSASVSWKACARKKINKMEYTDSDCYVHKPTHKPTFIWRNMLALNSRGIYSRSWNPPALNFLLKARMQSSFLFSLHLTNSFPQLQLFLLSSTSQVQSHWDLPLECHKLLPIFHWIWLTERQDPSLIKLLGNLVTLLYDLTPVFSNMIVCHPTSALTTFKQFGVGNAWEIPEPL